MLQAEKKVARIFCFGPNTIDRLMLKIITTQIFSCSGNWIDN